MAHEEKFIILIDQGVFRLDEQGRLWRLQMRVIRSGQHKEAKFGYRYLEKPRQMYQYHGEGYLYTSMRINKRMYTAKLHRIVYLYYNRETVIPKGWRICHVDGNRENNCIDNLELVAPWEPLRYRAKKKQDELH